mgnify:CR=1 FL=1
MELKKSTEKVNVFSNHTLNTVLQIATLFIPVAGVFISAGIGLMDAKQYFDEGDKKTGGLVAFLTLLPGVGGLVNKIPGVKTLTKEVAESLSKKLLTKSPLTTVEKEIINGIAENQTIIKSELNNTIKKMATTGLSNKIPANLKKPLTFIGKNGLIFGGYYAAAKGYEKTYDFFSGKEKNSEDFFKEKGDVTYTPEDLIFVDGEWALK